MSFNLSLLETCISYVYNHFPGYFLGGIFHASIPVLSE